MYTYMETNYGVKRNSYYPRHQTCPRNAFMGCLIMILEEGKAARCPCMIQPAARIELLLGSNTY